MDFKNWKNVYDVSFDYSQEQLAAKWHDLHQWDGEPFPSAERVASEIQTFGRAIANPSLKDDPDLISERLISGWIDFHAGRFARAVSTGIDLGPIGHYLVSAAASIYGFYFAESKERLDIFKFAYALAQETANKDYNHINTHYMYACNLGRWGESVSKFKAMQTGVPLKFRAAIIKTLEQNPNHIYARTGLAAFQGMIIGESLESVARFTFGATKEKCYGIFERVIEDAPSLPLPMMQYGRSIMMIEGAKKGARGLEYIRQASEATARDVMEKLDIRYARSLLV